jgi:sulfatase modifying factor 1
MNARLRSLFFLSLSAPMSLFRCLFRRIACAALLCHAAGQAGAAVYTDQQAFLSDNPGLNLIDFEGIATPGTYPLLPQPQQGVRFSGRSQSSDYNPNLITVVDSSDPSSALPSDAILVNSTEGYSMRVTFDRLYAKVGLRVRMGRGGVSARVRAYSNGTVVADQTFVTPAAFTFIGFTEVLGIDLIDVSAAVEERGNTAWVDDVRFGTEVIDTSDVPRPIEWKMVGNAGNRADSAGFGDVSYNYRISKHEITNGQYVEFLNAVAASDSRGLFNTASISDPRAGLNRSGSNGSYQYSTRKNFANKPVTWISFHDAARFVNWMHNGKGNGSTETGVYNMASSSPVRIPGAKYFLPTENEWYKAACYDPTAGAGGGDNYWTYATRSDTPPIQALSNGSGTVSNPGFNVANYNSSVSWDGLRGHLITVGSAGPESDSFYGTADQTGNLMEWCETEVQPGKRAFRGGSWNFPESFMPATRRDWNDPTNENTILGFRLAAAAPEVSLSIPGTASLLEDAGGSIAVQVSRTGDTDLPLTVNLAIAGGATAGTDYTTESLTGTTIVIPAGSASVTFHIDPVTDNLAESDETVAFNLLAGNDYNRGSGQIVIARILNDDFSPIAGDDSGYQVTEDDSLSVPVASGVLANDADQDDGNGPGFLTAELVGTTTHGVLVLNPDGSFSYTPQRNYFGTDSFTYRASDGTNVSEAATVMIEVSQLVDLQLAVTTTPAVVAAPGIATHTLTLSNHGPSNATGVVVGLQLILPSGVTVSALPSLGSVIDDRWTLDLAEDQSATVTLTYTVSSSARGGLAGPTTRAEVLSAAQPIGSPENDSVLIATPIISPLDVSVVETEVSPRLDRQQGLLTQKITISNHNPIAIAGFRILIGGLLPGVQVHNRSGLTPEGIPYIDWGGTLAPGALLALVIEFFQPVRGTPFDPSYSVITVLTSTPELPEPAATGAEPTRLITLGSGDVLIEFNTVPGGVYAIEYSHNLTQWHRVQATVTVAANRTQWVDAGPPKTMSHPSDTPVRYYRVVTLSE